ncbi:hypothetical protein BBJ66_11400 [Rhizobium sp. RSm-3]|nr:hypothetical protein BBJ66_11400 [Rhizobium sp. RSm-3]
MLVSSPDGLAAIAALRCGQERETGMCPKRSPRHRQIGYRADEYNKYRVQEKTGRAVSPPGLVMLFGA